MLQVLGKKRKLIGIFVGMLLIATALPAVGTVHQKETSSAMRTGIESVNHESFSRNIFGNNFGGMFIQLPYFPSASGCLEYASEPDRQIIEDFWGITDPIYDVHWWGEYVLYEGGEWQFLDPELMRVNISFFKDSGGQPGDLVDSYINVKPTVYKTGIWYDWGNTFLWQMYYFEYYFDVPISLQDGWVSISSVRTDENNGWLLWINSPNGNNQFLRNEYGTLVTYYDDVALVLTDGHPVDPDLECDGGLSWTDVDPGSVVSGEFYIRNYGDPGSVLHWNVSEFPNWGNWTASPESGYLTTTDGWITIDVEVEVPNEPLTEFEGRIKVINTFDTSDYCDIDVYLKTPKNIVFDLNQFFLTFLEQHPFMFPILRFLLGL